MDGREGGKERQKEANGGIMENIMRKGKNKGVKEEWKSEKRN